MFAIENDEYHHNNVSEDCEFVRMLDYTSAHVGARVIFIRINCDSYTDKNNIRHNGCFKMTEDGDIELVDDYNLKIKVLVKSIKNVYNGKIIDITPKHGLLGVVYMNYPHDSKHIQYALNKLGENNIKQVYF